ncbi:hypothetical protein [Pseudoalteromonas phage vB_PtuP_Slicky01]|nr:hypothetical protein [Pseudoalteromonas phage vB_PtuP_Slicky01]
MFIFLIVVAVILCICLMVALEEDDDELGCSSLGLLLVVLSIMYFTTDEDNTSVTEDHNAEAISTQTPATPQQPEIPVDLLDDLTIAATECNSAKVILITSIGSGSLDAKRANEIISSCKLSKLREELNK